MRTKLTTIFFAFIWINCLGQVNNDKEDNFLIIEDLPTFIYEGKTGDEALKQYVYDNLIYPKYAFKRGISGRVFVQWTINPKSCVENVHIVRGVDPSIDFTTVLLIKNMPNWVPGKCRGKTKPITYTFPVTYDLLKVENKNITNEYDREIRRLIRMDSESLNSILYKNNFNSKASVHKDSSVILGSIAFFPQRDHINQCYLQLLYENNVWSTIKLDSLGRFKTIVHKKDATTLLFELYDATQISKRSPQYYRVEINNVTYNSDTLNIGIIPFLADSGGYLTDWSESGESFFGRRKFTESVMDCDMPERLIREAPLVDYYSKVCIKCDSLFVTKKYRQMTIDHIDLLKLSEILLSFK